jgi:L-ascorbate metabolism protein UlaG (beta-lactamase superfamily)
MIYVFAGLAIAFLIVYWFVNRPKFGKLPTGARLETIKRSPNYRNGSFQNINPTPNLTEGTNYFSLLNEFFLKKKVRNVPVDLIPSKKTDLKSLRIDQDVLVWFGHSSYFIQVDRKRILVDPVLSGAASPIAATTRAFRGTDIYSVDEIPEIDFLFISHDHWDHLDYQTVMQLRPGVKKVICGLGVGAHLEHWGYDRSIIIERDWNEIIDLGDGFVATTMSARHFSGRGLSRNKSLWLSYILETPSMKIFIGGDSGYDTHFKAIGDKYGPFDLAILENGQYDKSWRYIHMLPEEFLRAAKELRADRIFPVHSSKFALGNHSWDEPLIKVTKYNETEKMNVITPMIGEMVELKNKDQKFGEWWLGIN